MSELFSALISWLQDPRIRVEVVQGDEVQQLRSQCSDLKSALKRSESLLRDEVCRSIRYHDLLRSNGFDLK